MIVATLLAIVASIALTIGLYFMKRESERLPTLHGWQPRAWLSFVRDPWWLFGVALQTVGYGLYLCALRDAPLGVVHTALTAGIAFFVVLAVFGLGERVRPLEWVGVMAVVSGLIALGVSLEDDANAAAVADGIWTFAAIVIGSAVSAMLLDRSRGRPLGLSIATGLILGLAGLFAKQLAAAESFTSGLLSAALALTLGTNIVGFVLMQAALQRGRGVIVVPILSTLSNLVPIVGGMVVFGEEFPRQPGAAFLRVLSMVLALGGAGVLAVSSEGGGERGQVSINVR